MKVLFLKLNRWSAWGWKHLNIHSKFKISGESQGERVYPGVLNLKFLRIKKIFKVLVKFPGVFIRKDKKQVMGASGYTIIEVMITLTMVSIAFVSIYALFAKSMQADTESRYEITAAALAQEGIEIVKNKREKNEMDWAIWNPDTDGPTPPGSFVGLDAMSDCNPELSWNPSYSFSCGVNHSDLNMQYNETSGKYEANCSGACVGPVFKRSCTAVGLNTDAVAGNDSLQIICTVEWKSVLLGGNTRRAKAETVLTDWQR